MRKRNIDYFGNAVFGGLIQEKMLFCEGLGYGKAR